MTTPKKSINKLNKQLFIRILKEFGIYGEFLYEATHADRLINIQYLDGNETWLQGIDKLLWWDETKKGWDYWKRWDEKMNYVHDVILHKTEIHPLYIKLRLLKYKK